jgi:hypothetical protein
MKNIKKILPLCIFLIAGTLAAQAPDTITGWTEQHRNEYIYGMGISTNTDESGAYQEAKSSALADLASGIEVQIAAVVQDFKSTVTANGKTGSAEQFSTGTSMLANQSIKMAQIYGPATNKKGTTYIIAYVDKRRFQENLDALTEQAFAKTDDSLDQLLFSKKKD